MNFSISFRSEVEEEVLAGLSWYNEKSPGLGDIFLQRFYDSINELQQNPLLYPACYQFFRRRLMKRFPYVIYYMVENADVIVFGFFIVPVTPKISKKP